MLFQDFIQNFLHDGQLLWGRFVCIESSILFQNNPGHVSVHRISDNLFNVQVFIRKFPNTRATNNTARTAGAEGENESYRIPDEAVTNENEARD